jgi:hypothetical protein
MLGEERQVTRDGDKQERRRIPAETEQCIAKV